MACLLERERERDREREKREREREREKEREREREIRLILRPFHVVSAVIFRERCREAEKAKQFQTRNIADNY